ncbi:MAG: 5'-methylthioadenosine/adenosylhomocysteine nucleosidase, partial [Atopostipes suicloacalis]|nr:5'-methylthioadenosine/adenosylhomocysteine nucleosidase [Atopostipes suicloacalis]
QRFYDGYIGDKAVCIVQAGIGKVNAALASSLLIQHFNVEQIINTGSAGAIQEGLKIGDLVISDKLTYHDADNRAFGYRYGQIPQMPEIYEADQDLNKEVSAIAEKQQWKIHNGLIVTGDSFVSSAEEIQRIRKHFPLALVTEMEGAAVAQSCYQYNIPCVVIRAVSDTADGEATIDFDDFVLLAGKRSAELVLALIKNIG